MDGFPPVPVTNQYQAGNTSARLRPVPPRGS